MAVVSVEELPGRSGGFNGSGLRLPRRWKVVTDERTDDAVIVLQAAGLPAIGDVHDYALVGGSDPAYAGLYCVDLACEEGLLNLKDNAGSPVAGGSTWTVTAQYSNIFEEINSSISPLYPTQPAKYNGNSTVEFKGVDYDKNGDLITNLAGDPFRPRLQRWFPNDTLEIEVSLAFGDLPSSATYVGKVNAATYKGKPAGTVICTACTFAGPFKQAGVTYYTARVSLAYAEETWDVRHGKTLQQGFREKVVGVFKMILDENGNDVTEPRLLKLDGGNVLATDDPSEASWLDVELYPTADFTGIDY